MMEDFGAQLGDVSTVSTAEVSGADLVLLVVAWRYGYVPAGSTLSITEQEYDEALRLGKDCLVFLADPSTEARDGLFPWPSVTPRTPSSFPSTEESTALLRSAEQQCRKVLTLETLAQHPHIVAWRDAYRHFGAKPKKYLCSVEALLQRTLKGQDLPAVNGVVDLYNMLSLKYVLPVGGEDCSKLTSDLRLTYARGNEPFLITSNGQEQVTYPDPGEIVWADDAGVTCRRWNWRQGRRTQLTYETHSIYFVLDRLAPYRTETLLAAGEELKEHLLRWFPHRSITTELLTEAPR